MIEWKICLKRVRSGYVYKKVIIKLFWKVKKEENVGFYIWIFLRYYKNIIVYFWKIIWLKSGGNFNEKESYFEILI